MNELSILPNSKDVAYKTKIIWRKLFFHLMLHIALPIGAYHIWHLQLKSQTTLLVCLVFAFGGIGTAVGAHRLFAHQSFKATRGCKIFLLGCNTLSTYCSLLDWARLHRLHHKFSETNSDPMSINRGIFFAYVGHYCQTMHPDCQREFDRINMNDIKSDSDLMFQHKYYNIIWPTLSLILPTFIPYCFWGESLWIAFWMNLFRYSLNLSHLNCSNTINHTFGNQPYDNSISATENRFAIFWTFGEGYHNFHHAFPMDYKGAEHGGLEYFNVWAVVIDTLEKFGFASDKKTTSPTMIAKSVKRTRDKELKSQLG